MTSGGVRVGYEVFGDGEPTVLLLPTWTIVHSRFWKLQVPYLARHFRVVTFDRPGNGRSDRALDPLAHRVDAVVDQALSVLEATSTDRVVLVSLSQGVREALKLAAEHADRVLGAILIGPTLSDRPGPSRTRWRQQHASSSRTPMNLRVGSVSTRSTGATTIRTSPSSSSPSASPSLTPPSSARTALDGPARRPRRCCWRASEPFLMPTRSWAGPRRFRYRRW